MEKDTTYKQNDDNRFNQNDRNDRNGQHDMHKTGRCNEQTTDKMYDKTRQAGNYAKDTAMKAENATRNGLDKAAGKVEEFGSKIKDATKDGISKAADKVKETTDRMADKVQNKMR